MSTLSYAIYITQNGVPQTGLTPTWPLLKLLAAPNTDVTPQPAIAEIGLGLYGYAYDAESLGEAVGIIDAGGGITSPAERYYPVVLDKLSPKVINDHLALGANGLIGVTLTEPADHTHVWDNFMTAFTTLLNAMVSGEVSSTRVATDQPGTQLVKNQAGTVIATSPYDDDRTTFTRHKAT